MMKGGGHVVEDPLKIFEKLDPELLGLVKNTNDLALSDGALPKRVKLLIAMALDASHGTVEGVRSLARAAIQDGATQEEITETLRVAHYISGVGCVYTAARALEGLF
jgi:alkylhydroperoxidase/carboxymuconolactone decarboxylase family protein YurZ